MSLALLMLFTASSYALPITGTDIASRSYVPITDYFHSSHNVFSPFFANCADILQL